MAQPGSPHGRCAIKPRSAGDFYVSFNCLVSSCQNRVGWTRNRGLSETVVCPILIPTVIYTRVMNKGPLGVKSPLTRLGGF